MGTLMIDLQIGPATFSTLFQVLRIPTSFNLLLGRLWIHIVGVIPSSLHQKVKSIHDGQVITVRSTRDIFAASKPVLQISHNEDDLLLTGYDFSTWHGLGQRQQGPSEFIAAIDHDTTFKLGFIPTEVDYRYMARLRKERVLPRLEEIDSVVHTDRETKLQHLFHQLQLKEITDDGVIVDSTEMIDGVVPHDEYCDEMDMMTVSQITSIVQLQPVSPFDMFGVSTIEILERTQTIPIPELLEDDSSLFEGNYDEIAQPGSDRDSLDYDSDPIDVRVSPATGNVETVDFGTEDQPRELKIGSPLSIDERDRLIHLLRSYLDVFAWSYEDMPGLDPSIVQHHLPTLPHARPVKQKLRLLHPRWSLQVKEEIQKQLSVRFISVVEYPEWLANVVPVPKKDGKVRVCVDFRDLNKARPKDDFLLPHIDLLVDSTAGHSMVMPFGLKNAGATYQRVATTLFHNMMHRDVEVYVDDMIVKSQNQPTVWNDDCQFAFEKIKEYLLSPPVLVPPTSGRPLLLYLSVSDMALGCMLAQIDDSGKERAIYYLKFDIQYVSQKSIKGSNVADHLASLPTSEDRPVDDDFPDEEFVVMTSLLGWCMYFDGATNQSGYGIGVLLVSPQGDHIPRSVRLAFSDRHPATNNIVEYEVCILGLETALELDIRQMEVFGDSNLVLRHIQGDWKTKDVKLRPYHAYLELLVARFDDLRYVHLPRAQNRFTDTLATLASSVDIPVDFLTSGTYPEVAIAKDRRALRNLATRFVICGDTLYRRSADGMLLLCLDRASVDRVMREVHAGVCGPHMGGHMLARKIMRTCYFWLTMKTDCCQFVQKCPECQIHGDLIHAPPSELHALTSPWPFSVWGIDIIGKVSPKSSSGHEFILVAIDYFTKWVEAASYARLTSARVASFIRSHIICHHGVPHELISDREAYFRAKVDTLLQEYGIRHHRSSAYRPQTNGAVEAANKNIKRILRKMVETSRDWSKKLHFALWAYRTSFCTSTGATPYSLVYGMEAVLPIVTEMGSLRVALEQQISETEWAQARFDQLNLLDERRLRAVDHVQAYQRKMAHAFKKGVKPRPLQKGDLVLRILRGLIGDPRGKFRPSWSGSYVIRELTPKGAAWLTDLDGNQFSEPTNVDQLKKYYV
ncbi:Gypsy retrotransposon integrase-like protein 1 [Vitis vinifera]|uniref:Gypsy retrotransposon integrase-like protein 1 n=1 Tax=Vitis vinifera TaxID=29760 RepID=A0A438D1K7_VITVI|nr:Gypsy retrotransposon integrase-like protein 1 [Vitis vinifera]